MAVINRPHWTRPITNPGHVVASTACLGGQLPKLVAAGDTQGVYSFCKWCRQIFGEGNFFVELQCGVTPEQIDFNKRIVRFCKHFGFEWIITNDVHYLIRLATDLKKERAARIAAENKIEEQAPKVAFAEAVEKAADNIHVADMARILSQKGFKIGQNQLFALLRAQSIFMSGR